MTRTLPSSAAGHRRRAPAKPGARVAKPALASPGARIAKLAAAPKPKAAAPKPKAAAPKPNAVKPRDSKSRAPAGKRLVRVPQPRVDWRALAAAAEDVAKRAHAPYSRYAVGAAILSRDGRIFAGCNVENASYGLGICAERAAVVQMVAAGGKQIAALALRTPGEVPAMPCGACRQTLAELALDSLPIHSTAGTTGAVARTTLGALLPRAFRSPALRERRR